MKIPRRRRRPPVQRRKEDLKCAMRVRPRGPLRAGAASIVGHVISPSFIVKAVIRKIKTRCRQIVLKLFLPLISDLLLLLLKTSFFPAQTMISQPASDTIRREFIRSKEILNAPCCQGPS